MFVRDNQPAGACNSRCSNKYKHNHNQGYNYEYISKEVCVIVMISSIQFFMALSNCLSHKFS